MTKINEPANLNSVKRASKKNIGASDGAHSYFADIMAMVDMATNINEVASSVGLSGVAPLAAMDSLLSIQEIGQETGQEGLPDETSQVKHAALALDSLEELRLSLLAGEIPHYLLTNLETNMNALKHTINNPQLREVIEDIEIRAAVELAKFYFQR